MNNLDKEILALVIINNKNFANAYDLCKVLAWKFNLINCSEIIRNIKSKNLIATEFPVSKTLEFFTLTEIGLKLIAEKKEDLILKLKEEFPLEINFINNL